jgi:hypothetical protein
MTLLATKAAHGGAIVAADGSQIVFDVVSSETHADRWRITDHPVTSAASVSDHIQREPSQVEMEGVVSNTPLYIADPEQNRANSAYDLLLQIAARRELVEVVTRCRLYQNMAIAEVSRRRGSDISANEARLTVRLKQVVRAEALAATVDPAIFADEVRSRAAEDEDAGNQAPVDNTQESLDLTLLGAGGTKLGGESIPEIGTSVQRLHAREGQLELPQ